MKNKQWEFFDFGWLNIFKTKVDSTAYFHTNKSKLLIFSVNNCDINIICRQDSLKHAIVVRFHLYCYAIQMELVQAYGASFSLLIYIAKRYILKMKILVPICISKWQIIFII